MYLRGYDILRVCNVLAVVFTLVTIFFLTGLDRKTVAAILSTLCVLALIMGIFLFTMNHTAALDYSMMEYLGRQSIRKMCLSRSSVCGAWCYYGRCGYIIGSNGRIDSEKTGYFYKKIVPFEKEIR